MLKPDTLSELPQHALKHLMNHQVAAAHSCLSDPEQREDYDRKLASGDDDFGDFGFGDFGDFMFGFMFGRGRCNCRWCR